MDPIRIHLLLNHIPILGSLFGLLLLGYGLLAKTNALINAGLVAILFVAIFSVPVYFSGEEAEDLIEDLRGTSEPNLEKHEELSSWAYGLALISGTVSAIALVFRKRKKFRVLRVLAFIMAFITFSVMTAVGNYGGKIRHIEIRE